MADGGLSVGLATGKSFSLKSSPDPMTSNSYRATRTEAFNVWQQGTCVRIVVSANRIVRIGIRPSDIS